MFKLVELVGNLNPIPAGKEAIPVGNKVIPIEMDYSN